MCEHFDFLISGLVKEEDVYVGVISVFIFLGGRPPLLRKNIRLQKNSYLMHHVLHLPKQPTFYIWLAKQAAATVDQ